MYNFVNDWRLNYAELSVAKDSIQAACVHSLLSNLFKFISYSTKA